jgi:hypothetical protein
MATTEETLTAIDEQYEILRDLAAVHKTLKTYLSCVTAPDEGFLVVSPQGFQKATVRALTPVAVVPNHPELSMATKDTIRAAVAQDLHQQVMDTEANIAQAIEDLRRLTEAVS